MSDYRNEDGEWLMDAAAIRLEQSIDAQAAEERFEDEFYSRDWEDNDDAECDVDNDVEGGPWCFTHDRNADECEAEADAFDNPMEDQWLDGSYEE